MKRQLPHTDTPSILLDIDQIRAIASDRIVKRGIAYFKEDRVTDLEWDDDRISALVEGSTPGFPYSVELSLDRDGELFVDCECPFDWEPVCKHAVATLLAFNARTPVAAMTVDSAADQAIEDRAKRGRAEVVVEPIDVHGHYGTWKAWSLRSYRSSSASYRVEIRSQSEHINYCTCPDHATNRLGTCKHVEAVLHRIRKETKKKVLVDAPEERPCFIYLAWDAPEAPRIALSNLAALAEHERKAVADLVDEDGLLTGEPPHAFHKLLDLVADLPNIHVGEDAVRHARVVAEQVQHLTRGREIAAQIKAAGQQLPGITARLYPYQIEGVAFLASTGRALLADDMGLGKTLQAIAAARWLMDAESVNRVLVVCPASLKHQWSREIRRFTGLDTTVVQGPAKTRGVQYRTHTHFTVVNYELVLRDATVINQELAPDLLILDEAQRIRNWRTKTADAIKSLEIDYAFVLTGTPLENRLEDLYSVMQVIDPRALGPLWRYMLEFHVLDERGKVLGYRNLSELRRRLKPVMLRRDRRLIADQLPERIELRLDVQMDTKQQELHDAARRQITQYVHILKKRPLTPSEEKNMLACLLNARMACNAAGLVDKETVGSPKLVELGRLLEDLCLESDRKVVVFSEWERMTNMAEAIARKLGLGTIRLHGGIPTAKRGVLLDRFRADPATQVFLSTDAGGVGLNLQHADVVINLDMPWNPAVLEQRIARLHRMGQRQPVQVILLLAAESYEQSVAGTAASKQHLFDTVVKGENDDDVVGLSKRMIELLSDLEEDLEDERLDPGPELDSGEPADGKASADPDESEERPVTPSEDRSSEDPELNALVDAIQEVLGSRIERLLGVNGALLIVVDEVDRDAEEALARVDRIHIPVELIDARTRAALERLGSRSPLADARVLTTRNRPDPAGDGPPPLVSIAQRKLQAAEVLVTQSCHDEAVPLMLQSMLSTIAHRGQLDSPPEFREAAVWLFGTALPKGWVTDDETTAVARGLALAGQAAVTPELAGAILADARRFVATAR